MSATIGTLRSDRRSLDIQQVARVDPIGGRSTLPEMDNHTLIRNCRWTFTIFLALSISGCGSSGGPQRMGLRGTVTNSKGEPINGTISITPVKGTLGPVANATISGGQYEFDRSSGPSAGPHQVIIKRMIPKGDQLANRDQVKPVGGDKKAQADARAEWNLKLDLPAAGQERYDVKLDP